MSPSAGGVRSVRLRVPAAWIELDLDPVTGGAAVEQLVAERAQGQGDQAALRALLEAAVADARGQGAVYAALFFDTVEGRSVSASLVVSVVEAEGGDEPPADGENLEGFRLAIARGVQEELQEGGSPAELRALEAGPAVRDRRRQLVGEPGSGAEVDVLQYFVPFPQGDRLAVLTFSTPNVRLGDAFGQVFDAIAGTLQWTPN